MNKGLYFLCYAMVSTVVGIMAVSCSSSDGEDGPVDQDVIDQGLIMAYLEADSTITAQFDEATGIHIIPLTERPDGQALASGDIVDAYYEIRSLESGIVIDIKDTIRGTGSMRFGEAAIFPIGFDEALAFMRQGETYRFLVPSSKGYGDIEVSGLIAPHEVLDITISVHDIRTDADQLDLEERDINQYIIDNGLNDEYNTVIPALEADIVNLEQEIAQLRLEGGDPAEIAVLEAQLGVALDNLDNALQQIDTVRLTTGGIYIKKTIKLDSGRLVGVGQDIAITYLGTLLNGEPFDGTFGNETFEYTFGRGEVITGLDAGVAELFFGESAVLIIPSELAYGESVHVMPELIRDALVGRDVIPSYAGRIGPFEPLVFDMRLLP